MTAMPASQTMTAQEFLELPRDRGGWSSWLVEGEVVVNQPGAPHQRLVLRLVHALTNWVEGGTGRGFVYIPLDIGIDERNVYAPDASWWPEGRDPADEGAAPFSMPAIAIEVRSPSTWRYDTGAKKSGYERAGLPELWLVDSAANEVLVFRRSTPSAPTFDIALQLGDGGVLASPLLPGFNLPLGRLFA